MEVKYFDSLQKRNEYLKGKKKVEKLEPMPEKKKKKKE